MSSKEFSCQVGELTCNVDCEGCTRVFSREVFIKSMNLDKGTWNRGKG